MDYDDTPRLKRYGLVAKNVNPDKFEKYLIDCLKKTKEEKQPFLFITAWNEWGESDYLEPDKKYGYRWLEAVKNAKIKAII